MSTGTQTTDETTTSFGITFPAGSPPHPHRLLVLACYHGVAAAATATIQGFGGGTGGTVCHVIQNTAHEFSIFFIGVPTQDGVRFSLSATSSLRKAVTPFLIYPQNPIPLASGTDSANAATDAVVSNLQVQAGGYVIYNGGQHATLGTFTTTWGGTDSVVESVDAQIEAGSYTAGYIQITNSTSTNGVTMAESASGTKRLVAASWGPPL